LTTYAFTGPAFGDAGGCQSSATAEFKGIAAGERGSVGAPTVMAAVAAEFGPVPALFLAATLNVYVWPLLKPVMTCERAVDENGRDASADDPTYGVTTYPVIAEPLFVAGALQRTVACALPGVALGDRGAEGGEIAAYDVGAPRSATHNAHVSNTAVRQDFPDRGRVVMTSSFIGFARGAGNSCQNLHSRRAGGQGGSTRRQGLTALIRAQRQASHDDCGFSAV
jgi:hypothetical protein